MLIRIAHDVFDIADRVKELDEGYYPVFNTETQRYEIRHYETENQPQRSKEQSYT